MIQPFKQYALQYWKSGFRVFPLKPKSKKPQIEWKRFQTRNSTETEVIKWVKLYPNANIGVVTGNGLVVVDVDDINALKKFEFHLTPTLITQTGRGWHYYYTCKGSLETSRGFGEKVDIKCDGGYAVAPGSVHPSGAIYKLPVGSTYSFGEMDVAPKWLQERKDKEKRIEKSQPGWLEKAMQGVEEGARNDTCAKIAGYYAAKGFGHQDIKVVLEGWNSKNKPAMSREEIDTVIHSILKKEGGAKPKVKPCTLEEARRVVKKWLYLEDDKVIDLTLATIISTHTSEDPIWIMLVSPPSTGKTEILRAFDYNDSVYYIGSLTPHTFATGLKNVRGILERFNGKKITMINKDFSSLLSMPAFDRMEVLDQLRNMYDGRYDKEWGTGKKVNWRGKISFVAGVTPDIENHYSLIRALGERFLYYRMEASAKKTRRKILEFSDLMESRVEEAREEIAHALSGVVEKYNSLDLRDIKIDDVLLEWLKELSDICTVLRTHIPRDSYNRDIISYRPSPEGPSRVYKALKTLVKSVAFINERREVATYDYEIAVKLCLDCIPSLRREVLKYVLENYSSDAGLKPKECAERTGYITTTLVRYNLDDLSSLGLLDRYFGGKRIEEGDKGISQGAPAIYKMREEVYKRMDRCGLAGLL